ncbi:serine hydrolase domain-containing protein [Bacillus sp. 1P06AnD]|uniref:serine hydrolase domain-containing protein n=1 Tax=Bacillus sp. 1P06AnD TaxID=3132208 RepID=UPI0039A1D0A9
MLLKKNLNHYSPIINHVEDSMEKLHASAAACLVIHRDKIVAEKYWGHASNERNTSPIDEDHQFYVASVRKSYIGFAVAYCVMKGYIQSIDDPVTAYLTHLDSPLLDGVTIRHLLTHTHGLKMERNTIIKEFPPGCGWAYRGINIEWLTTIVKQVSGLSVKEIARKEAFDKLGFSHTDWHSQASKQLVPVLSEEGSPPYALHSNKDGSQMNMYISLKELAYWGYLHLKKGKINGSQLVPAELIELATTLHSPSTINKDDPQNGFLWFVKETDAQRSEIGSSVPEGAFQILGYTGVTLLVIPSLEICAVRMFNRLGSTPDYDYLNDVRTFGDCVVSCAQTDR